MFCVSPVNTSGLVFVGLAGLVGLWAWTGLVASMAAHPSGIVFRNLSPYVWFFQGVPVEATYTPSPLQSVQHIPCTTNTTATFTAVNLSYAVISMVGGGLVQPFGTLAHEQTRAQFTSATTAICQSLQTAVQAAFDVIEFVPSLVKHQTTHDLQVTIPVGANNTGDVAHGYTVTLGKALAFFQGCVMTNQQSDVGASFTVTHLSPTTLRVYKSASDDGYTCAVSMAEFK